MIRRCFQKSLYSRHCAACSDTFAGYFTRPTFLVFIPVMTGIIAQVGNKTVCGMLTGMGKAEF